MAQNDHVFGLPFLFTGGLPTALDKFTEGNLKCFLIYLIEVSAKANRLNVWQQPVWWNTNLIPYSPIEVDTSHVPPSNIVGVLRDLVSSCYKYYNAERILEVSKKLSELPRIFLRIKNNGDNTRTLYDACSRAVYVTVRPENLTYDVQSLEKVSKCWQETYKHEDVTFCEIKNVTSQVTLYKRQDKPITNSVPILKPFLQKDYVISLSDSSDEDVDMQGSSSKEVASIIHAKEPVSSSLADTVVELSDSDSDDLLSKENSACMKNVDISNQQCDSDDDVQFVGLYTEVAVDSKDKNIQLIVLSDSEDEDTNRKLPTPSPLSSSISPKKSILGPLSHPTTLNESIPVRRNLKRRRKSPVRFRSIETYSPSAKKGFYNSGILTRTGRHPVPFPPSPSHSPIKEKSKYLTKDDFLSSFSLVRRSNLSILNNSPKTQPRISERSSTYFKCPLDWLKLFSRSSHRIVFVSKKTKKPYEEFCSTDPKIVAYSIYLSSTAEESKNEDYQTVLPSYELPGGRQTFERWCRLEADNSRRRRRASIRLIRSCMGDFTSAETIRNIMLAGTLAPKLTPLPQSALNSLFSKQYINMNELI